ncbi:MAG: hypothetical protein ACHQ1D_01400, partial [Nitrososphaerales archaeon]
MKELEKFYLGEKQGAIFYHISDGNGYACTLEKESGRILLWEVQYLDKKNPSYNDFNNDFNSK